jgi:tellurite resistance protein TerC
LGRQYGCLKRPPGPQDVFHASRRKHVVVARSAAGGSRHLRDVGKTFNQYVNASCVNRLRYSLAHRKIKAMDQIGNPMLWSVFVALVIVALIVDFVALKNQGPHRVTFREATVWSLIWVALSFAFNAALWFYLDGSVGREVANEKSMEFLTGYLIEKSLAVDNLFVFLMIFTYFAVPQEFQKRALTIGIIAAIVLRTVMILIGAILIEKFHWILYFFGAFLVYTGWKMWSHGDDDDKSLDDNPILKFFKRFIKVTDKYDGEKFFTVQNGVRIATPMLLVILMIGFIDVVFAVDSIPAIFAITTDPFIVLTSNIFAILGLRAMFFMLAELANRFSLLQYGLAIILVFIGVKMLLIDVYKIPVAISLGVVATILAVTMVLSWKRTEDTKKPVTHV